MSDIWMPIDELAEAVSTGRLTARAQVEKALSRIQELNGTYQAVIATLDESALARAKEIDQRVSDGKNVGRLAGVPFIAKDNYLVFGAETTAASNILRGFTAPYQSSAIEKLEAEGAICVAKANLDAFAHGGSTENSDFFVTKNPHDTTRVAGGSSGGSAASVALEMVPFALGTDTGGSIRQPASYCGVVGYKPSYGLVSRSGVVAMASSTDVLGPFARSVAECALVLECMAGYDGLDSTLVARDSRDYSSASTALKGKKFGIIAEYLTDDVQSGVAENITRVCKLIEEAGGSVSTISMPSLPLALAAYYIICPAELSSNLARYDGQRFQYSAEDAQNLDESYTHTRSRGFGAEAKRRIMIGTHVLSSGYYDAYYKKAQTVRTKICDEFERALSEVDFLVGPVAPSTAFKIGENTSDPVKMYLEDIMTVAANLAGVPSISIPCGKVDNLPVGLQVMAAQSADYELLAVSREIEGLL